MTLERQNQIIKEAWVRNLQTEKDIPESIGSVYKNWLLGKIKQATSQLVQQSPEQEQSQNQSQAQTQSQSQDQNNTEQEGAE